MRLGCCLLIYQRQDKVTSHNRITWKRSTKHNLSTHLSSSAARTTHSITLLLSKRNDYANYIQNNQRDKEPHHNTHKAKHNNGKCQTLQTPTPTMQRCLCTINRPSKRTPSLCKEKKAGNAADLPTSRSAKMAPEYSKLCMTVKRGWKQQKHKALKRIMTGMPTCRDRVRETSANVKWRSPKE